MSDSTPPKMDAESLVLKAAPRRVVRFKRNLLIGIAAVGCVAIFGITWMALKGPGFRPGSGGSELLSSDRKPTPDGLANLPGNYGQMAKPVTPLGPPLPGDLGPPIVAREKQLGVNPAGEPFRPNGTDDAARAERLRLAQQARQAQEAGVFFQLTQHAAAPSASAGPPAAATTVSSLGADATHLSLDPDRDQNAQQHKLDFVNQAAAHGITNDHALQTPASPYEVLAGTVIAASLITGVNSDLPGEVIAQVTENVYDTVTGRFLLIPQGARLIGKYDSQVAFGQSRVLLVWDRIIMPDGKSIVLERQEGADTQGYAGLEDEVDYHWWDLAKAAVLSTLLGVGSDLGSSGSNDSDLVHALRQGAQDSISNTGQQIVRRQLNIQPTLTIRSGFPVRVIVNRDLVLAPYVQEAKR